MKKSKSSGILAGLALICAGSCALANGFRNPPAGAEALARGGAKIAQVDDPSAVEHNPAAMTELKKPEAMAALTVINTHTDFDSPMGSASTRDSWKYLPNLFAVLPFENHPMAFGLGVTTPFGQSTVWNKDGAFRYTAPYSAELTVINVNPALAVKLNDQFSVAAGLDVFMSRLDIKQVMPWSMLTGVRMPDGTAHLEGDGAGVGANAAVMIIPPRPRRLPLLSGLPSRWTTRGPVSSTGFPQAHRRWG